MHSPNKVNTYFLTNNIKVSNELKTFWKSQDFTKPYVISVIKPEKNVCNI